MDDEEFEDERVKSEQKRKLSKEEQNIVETKQTCEAWNFMKATVTELRNGCETQLVLQKGN